jgi:hypothetical protein
MELDWILQITCEKMTMEVKYIALERRCCYKAKAPHVGRRRCTGRRWAWQSAFAFAFAGEPRTWMHTLV